MVKKINIILSTIVVIAVGFRYLRESETRRILDEIYKEIRPVLISNCSFKRYGPTGDGGYLFCSNLISGEEIGYSYGIENRDGWGCDMSKEFGFLVHQYDCFDLRRPTCEGGKSFFHEECIGGVTETIDGRFFDTLSSQIRKNGDERKSLIIKMDVEGSERPTILNTPDDTWSQIKQIMVEFHAVNTVSSWGNYIENPETLRDILKSIKKLKEHFVIANVHFANLFCLNRMYGFDSLIRRSELPSLIFEVTFVNKDIAIADYSKPPHHTYKSLQSPNFAHIEDCQPEW